MCSLDRREFTIDRLAREPSARTGYGAVEVIEEETTTFSTHRRHSVKSIQAMGNAFRAEDEEGEVFDSVYLGLLQLFSRTGTRKETKFDSTTN